MQYSKNLPKHANFNDIKIGFGRAFPGLQRHKSIGLNVPKT